MQADTQVIATGPAVDGNAGMEFAEERIALACAFRWAAATTCTNRSPTTSAWRSTKPARNS